MARQPQALTRPLGLVTLVLVAVVASVVARGPAGAAPDAAASPALGVIGFPDLDPLLQLATVPVGARRDGSLTSASGGAALSPSLITTCLEVAGDIDPAIERELRAIRKRDPARFAQVIRQSRRLVALVELKRSDPVLYSLKILELKNDSEVSRLAAEVRRARRTGSAELERLEAELKSRVILQAGLRHKHRADYLCRIREEVERLEAELEHEKQHFDEVLERRMLELTGR